VLGITVKGSSPIVALEKFRAALKEITKEKLEEAIF